MPSNKNILVTGGAGNIGSHTCKALATQGFTPVAYDNLAHGHEWAVKWGPLEVGDILDKARLRQVMEKYRPMAVMHFAAFAYVGESIKKPDKYYRNNVLGSLNLLEVMREHEIAKIIFSSTCATYGVPDITPIPDDHPQRPINPYGNGKLMVERILRDFDAAYGMRSISLRYFNASGADPDGEIGECHDPETHLIPLALDAALKRRPHIAIFGDDYNTPDGTCIRDYIHIADLAQAHILALQRLMDGAKTTFYNLGNGEGFSVREVINSARRVTGQKISAVVSQRRAGDPPVLMGNASRAIRELGWKPRYSELETQISHAWQWHQKYFNGKV